MKNIQLIYIISIFIALGCGEKETFYNLAKEDKPIYEINDTLIYRSILDNYDTLIVVEKINAYEIHDKKYHYEYITIKFKNLDNSSAPCSLEIKLNYLSLSWYSVYYSSNNLNNLLSQSVTINDITYDNVNELTEFTDYHNEYDEITKIYYNNRYCVLKYIFSNGEIFELIQY